MYFTKFVLQKSTDSSKSCMKVPVKELISHVDSAILLHISYVPLNLNNLNSVEAEWDSDATAHLFL